MELQAILAALRGVVQLFDTIERLGSFQRTEPTQDYLNARDEVRRQLVILAGTLGNENRGSAELSPKQEESVGSSPESLTPSTGSLEKSTDPTFNGVPIKTGNPVEDGE